MKINWYDVNLYEPGEDVAPLQRELYECGRGVFVRNSAGGMDPRPAWRHAIARLCRVIAATVGDDAQLASYESCPPARELRPGTARVALLVLSGRNGELVLVVNIGPLGNPDAVDESDLPRQSLQDISIGAGIEIWVANEADVMCLMAQLLVALDQRAAVRFDGIVSPTTTAAPYQTGPGTCTTGEPA
jgi:hypothetical protein